MTFKKKNTFYVKSDNKALYQPDNQKVYNYNKYGTQFHTRAFNTKLVIASIMIHTWETHN